MTDRIAGIIVAGGAGTRMGARKPLLAFGQGTLLDAVFVRVRSQVESLALNVPLADFDLYRQRFGAGLTLLADAIEPSAGPLGGVLAGLEWLRETKCADWLASFPCDTPFLPLDLVAQLRASVPARVPVAARDSNRTHALCALWPAICADALRKGIETGHLRSMMSAIEALGGHTCQIACDPHAFFNINTPEDLAAAVAIHERRQSIP